MPLVSSSIRLRLSLTVYVTGDPLYYSLYRIEKQGYVARAQIAWMVTSR